MANTKIVTGQYVTLSQMPASLGDRVVARLIDYMIVIAYGIVVGIIIFDTYYKGEHVNLVLNIFKATNFVGEPVETDEILPLWFSKNNIPYEQMLEDDIIWMEIVLKGQMVTGKVVFDENLKMQQNTIRVCEDGKFETLF